MADATLVEAVRQALFLVLGDLHRALSQPSTAPEFVERLAQMLVDAYTKVSALRPAPPAPSKDKYLEVMTAPPAPIYPEVMITKLAARYCQTSPAGIRYAVEKGKLRLAGRRGGGAGPYVFERADLDNFMRGIPPGGAVEEKTPEAPQRLSKPRSRWTRKDYDDERAAQIARLHEIAADAKATLSGEPRGAFRRGDWKRR